MLASHANQKKVHSGSQVVNYVGFSSSAWAKDAGSDRKAFFDKHYCTQTKESRGDDAWNFGQRVDACSATGRMGKLFSDYGHNGHKAYPGTGPWVHGAIICFSLQRFSLNDNLQAVAPGLAPRSPRFRKISLLEITRSLTEKRAVSHLHEACLSCLSNRDNCLPCRSQTS